MKSMLLLLLLAFAVLQTGCDQKNGHVEPRAGVNTHALGSIFRTNSAVLVGSPLLNTRMELPGVMLDIEGLKPILESDHFGYTVTPLYDSTVSSALNAIADAAVSAGRFGTLFVYYGGHGEEDGCLLFKKGHYRDRITSLSGEEMLTVIARARDAAGLPALSRMIGVFDSCHSGQWINGKQDLIALNEEIRAFREGVFIAAADKRELAQDLGSAGLFSIAFETLLKTLSERQEKVTLNKFLRMLTASVDDLAVRLQVPPQRVTHDVSRRNLLRNTLFD